MSEAQRREVSVAEWFDAHEQARAQGCTYFDFLAATDLGSLGGDTDQHHYEFLTHVMRPDASNRLFLIAVAEVGAGNKDPVVESLAQIYPAATWHEREAADLLGIVFVAHPDPRELIFEGSSRPLRRDFALEPRITHLWPGLYEPGSEPGTTRRKRPKPVPGVNPQWQGKPAGGDPQ